MKDIRDKAEAMRAYARQAKNKQLEVDASEIRFRAERRIGELMEAQRKAGGLAKGAKGNPGGRGARIVRVESGPAQRAVGQISEGRPSKNGSASDPFPRSRLADAGIDKHLADRARKYAAMPKEKFEDILAARRVRIEAENERVTVDLLIKSPDHSPGRGPAQKAQR